MLLTTMVKHLQARYCLSRNHLFNYEFHKLSQNKDESFDLFVNRVKHEAKNYQFSCVNDNCIVPQKMIRDQIVIGTINEDICQNTFKNGHQLEAAAHSTKIIQADEIDKQPTD